MMYFKLNNGIPEPYDLNRLQVDNPGVSFPSVISETLAAEFGLIPYTEDSKPSFNPMTEMVSDGSFRIEVGEWKRGWTVVPLPDDLAKSNVRLRRDRLLLQSDWVVTKAMEQGSSVPAGWQVYRASLRDIPQQPGFPYNVIWPTKPE